MRTCVNCGASNLDSLKTCGNCGQALRPSETGTSSRANQSDGKLVQASDGRSKGEQVRCAVCGSESAEGGKFCPRCGAILTEPIRLDDPRLVAAEEDLQRAIGARKSTDVIIEPWWAVVPLILTLVGAIAGVATILVRARSIGTVSDWADVMASMRDGFLVVIVFSVLSIAVLAFITYKLVKRRNDHFSREDKVRTALVQLIRSAAWSKERSDFVFPELRMIEQYVGYEQRRDPLLWSLAIAIGGLSIFGVLPFFFVSDPAESIGIIFLSIGLAALVGFISFVLMIYMFYWLGKDIKEHDTRWGILSTSARSAMSKLGFPYPTTLGYGITELPERSFALYLILTLFVSPFVYYWWYALIKDPNDHFRSQWVFEDELLATMKVQRQP